MLTLVGLFCPCVLAWGRICGSISYPRPAHSTTRLRSSRSIWEADGARIVEAMERLTGLEFETGPVNVIVYEGTSFSGYQDVPMRMRASYPRSTKQATLVHELAHRLISELVPGTFEPSIIFLFVYDAWVELWGSEFANHEVEVESARRVPIRLCRHLAACAGPHSRRTGATVQTVPQRSSGATVIAGRNNERRVPSAVPEIPVT